MIDRLATVTHLRQVFVENLGLFQVRLDRFALVPQPDINAFYIEMGTSLGEVRIRVYQQGKQVAAFNIFNDKQIGDVKRRVAELVAEAR